jgi:hypothetical protein
MEIHEEPSPVFKHQLEPDDRFLRTCSRYFDPVALAFASDLSRNIALAGILGVEERIKIQPNDFTLSFGLLS